MENCNSGNLIFKYENNSTSNYLVIIPEPERKQINYQAQMLLNNKIDGILNFHMNYIGQNWNFYYDITSKCSLSAFLSRKKFKRDEFLITLLRIINNIYTIRRYLLWSNNILLNSEAIYVEPKSMTICFVYLPFCDCKNDYKAFFIELIVNNVKFENEESDNYIQKLLETIKSDLFSLENLKQLIERLLGEDTKNTGVLPHEQVPEPIVEFPKKIKKPILKGTVKIPSNPNKKKSEEKYKGVKYEILLQIGLIAAFILTAGSSFVRMSENPKTTLLLVFILFLLADVLIIRIINEQKRKTNEKSNYNVLQFISDRMKGVQGKSEPDGEFENVQIQRLEIPDLDDKKEKKNSHLGETEIIKKENHYGETFLKEKEGENIIKIEKESLLVGRMDNFVDYVINNSAIGKIHAEIMKEAGMYYVMDCNSRNGTFVNGSRLLPNTKNRIKNNDEVRFANKEYIFIEALL